MKKHSRFRCLSGDEMLALARGKRIDLIVAEPLQRWCEDFLAATEGEETAFVKGYREAVGDVLGYLKNNGGPANEKDPRKG